MAPLARSALLARAFRAHASTARQTFTRVSRRTYASEHGHAPRQGGIAGDMPWLISSAAATAGGVYLLWPQPSAGGHGHGHDDHATEHQEEKEEEPAQEDQSKDEGKESKSEDEKEDKDESEKQEKESGTKENPLVNEDREDGNREVKYKDAKGGVKKRLESQNAIKQGNKGDQPEGKSANVSSGQGEHVFNTDTKHSIDAQGEPGISNKGEGDAETAKLKKPVDPNRPQK